MSIAVVRMEGSSALGTQGLVEELVAGRRPVVVSGLAPELDGLRSEAAVRERLGDVEILVHDNYTVGTQRWLDGTIEGYVPTQRRVAIGTYLDEARAGRTPLMCAERPLEGGLTCLPALKALPPFAVATLDRFFLGAAGSHSHLHFDGDARHVLLHQIMGRKRVVLIPIAATWKLLPVGNQSAVFLDRFDADDLREFLVFVGGAEVQLEPGDSLYMPPGIWHYAAYPDTCMSLSQRFLPQETPMRRFFAQHIHRGVHWLHWIQLLPPGRPAPALTEGFVEVAAAFFRPYETFGARYAAVKGAMRETLARLDPSYRDRAYANFRLEPYEEALWRGRGLYEDPPPDGEQPTSAGVGEAATRAGLPQEATARLLARVGGDATARAALLRALRAATA